MTDDRRHRPSAQGHIGDDLVDLVLGEAEGPRREEMVAHLLECASCRAEFDTLAAGAGSLLSLAPEVQPPLGFDERAIGRMRADAPDGTDRSASARSRTRRRRAVVLVAAAVLLLVSAVAVAWSAGSDHSDEIFAELQLTEGGDTVGSVSVADVEGRSTMVVAIIDAPPDVSYLCRTTLTDGSVRETAPWPPGDGAWLVPLPTGASIASVELINADTGDIWSTATIGH
jgi:hypothetical protein